MDCSSLTVVSDEGDRPWSDNHSMTSDEGLHDRVCFGSQSPSPANLWINPTATSQLEAGQLSPVSNGVDIPAADGSSAPTMVHSASSSCTDSWSTGYVEHDDADQDTHWEQGSDDVLTIPKLEPSDDDINLDDLKEAPLTPVQGQAVSPTTQPKIKRPRGRPRKHPLTPVIVTGKITKGRSKTGCITCRKRKKKCDEAKPRCMNCEKNAVVCEGYHEKQIWKSGKERAEDGLVRRQSLTQITIPSIFLGVETAEDKIFWKHYYLHLSNVLTVEGEARNAFKDIVLNLANNHQGLMHSILAVSSKHIDYDTPYGSKLLRDNPATTLEALQARGQFHHDEARRRFCEDTGDTEDQTALCARYGQVLCFLIGTLAEGNPHGEHRIHLRAYKALIQENPPQDPNFLAFITEFFQYHIYADELLWHPELNTPRLASENWTPPTSIHPPRLLGVADGLFTHLMKITNMRNEIRANIATGRDPPVNYTYLYAAADLDDAIRDWKAHWPEGDSRDRVGQLYQLTMFLYLFRTMYPPPVSSPQSITHANGNSHTLSASSTSSTSLHSATTSGHSTTDSSPGHSNSCSASSSRVPSRANSMHESSSVNQLSPMYPAQRPSSPPPIRRPSFHDQRIHNFISESLCVLESFKPSDPSQTLLLIPCLAIGTACFDPEQRERIRAAVRAVRGYTGLRNCDRVADLLEEVWHLMDQGDWLAVWDWQSVARRHDLDIICA